ncbi:MAG: heme biosynthesis HemY N-terminal domain-containing protein [Wenzhouxiangella sp.]
MKKLLLILLVLVAVIGAAWLAPILLDDPGHVRIDVGEYRIEMSLLVLAGLALALWLALSLAVLLIRAPGLTLRRARQARSRRQLESGLLALAEGDWQQAEKCLNRALHHRDSPAGYLAAARAAQGLAEPERRDAWLKLADGRFGRRHRVAGLTRARLLMTEGRPSEAIPILEALHLRKVRHAGILRLLLQAYQDAGRWRDLRLLTPALCKADIVDRARADELAELAAVRELESALDVQGLEESWRALPRAQRLRRAVVLAHARRATELGRYGLAEPGLRRLLNEAPDPEALKWYASADEQGRSARIADCRRWLVQHPDHADLHLALGRLYMAERDDERAREHLEKVLALRPGGEAYGLLGRVLDRGGQLEAAAHCYRNALRLQSGRGAEPLPAPGNIESLPDHRNSPAG